MRKINREINVFNLSAIDLFASAMGAFMLISLVALPDYLNKDLVTQQIAQLTSESQQIQTATTQANQALQQARHQNDQLQQQLDQLQEQQQERQDEAQHLQSRLSKNVLAVLINWETTADLDLYVTTPAGHEYSYKKPNRKPVGRGRRPDWPDEESELSFDAGDKIRGKAGIEVWTMANAAPGEYRVAVDKYASHGDSSPTRVEIAILSGNRVERKTMTGLTGTMDAAAIRVQPSGEVTVEWLVR